MKSSEAVDVSHETSCLIPRSGGRPKDQQGNFSGELVLPGKIRCGRKLHGASLIDIFGAVVPPPGGGSATHASHAAPALMPPQRSACTACPRQCSTRTSAHAAPLTRSDIATRGAWTAPGATLLAARPGFAQVLRPAWVQPAPWVQVAGCVPGSPGPQLPGPQGSLWGLQRPPPARRARPTRPPRLSSDDVFAW
jgi:hypothetical protein